MEGTIVNVNSAGILTSLGYSETLVFSDYESSGMKKILQAAKEAGIWLSRRYPDHDFEIFSAESGSTLQKTACFNVREGETACFKIYRYNREEGEAVFEETYWGMIHREEINGWAREKLELAGIEKTIPYLEAFDRFGDDCPPEATMKDLYQEDRKIDITGRIYLHESMREEDTGEVIAETLRKYFGGGVTLFYYDDTFELSLIPEAPHSSTKGITYYQYCFLDDTAGGED